MRKHLNRYDIAVMLLLPLAAFMLTMFFIAGGTGGDTNIVRISVDGRIHANLDLSRDGLIKEVSGGMNVIQIKGGTARMIHADCPDGACIRIGGIYRAGQFIVCLPNRVVVEVIGVSLPEVDAITR